MGVVEFLTKEDATAAFEKLNEAHEQLQEKYDQAVNVGQRYQIAYTGLAQKLNAMKLILSAPTEGA